MIEFLKDANISENTINLIEKQNGDNIYNLYCNEYECLRIIDYFRNIGITKIDELLINEIEVFYKMYIDVVEEFSKYNINNLVNSINNNYKIIEQVLFEG